MFYLSRVQMLTRFQSGSLNMLPAAENSRRATIGGLLLSALQDHDAVALKAEFLALVLYLADELGRGIVEFE